MKIQFQYIDLIGQKKEDITLVENANIRFLDHDAIITAEFVKDRVNICFDENNICERITIG